MRHIMATARCSNLESFVSMRFVRFLYYMRHIEALLELPDPQLQVITIVSSFCEFCQSFFFINEICTEGLLNSPLTQVKGLVHTKCLVLVRFAYKKKKYTKRQSMITSHVSYCVLRL